MTNKTSKPGQTGLFLLFLISRSAHVRWEVFACCSYDLWYPG